MKSFVERRALSKLCAVAAVAACGAFAAHADMTVAQAVDGGYITWSNATTNWVPNAKDPTLSDLVVKFSDTASAGTLTIDDMIEAGADYLVVGGGGAGGTSADSANGSGGGGGAGALAIVSNATFVAGTYTVTVGAGGVAATTYATPQPGGNGGDSSLAFPDSTAVTMKGGGGGGAASVGSDGGSGGGGSFYGSGTLSGGSAIDADYGNDGGSSSGAKFSAGGGGAGAAGKNGNKTASGRGGLGVTNYIAGVMNIYAAGGAGGKNANNTGIKGGANNEYGNGGAKNASATAGEDGTGGGGGGGGAYVDAVANGLGANGGSGAVIVRLTSARVVRITMPSATDWTYDGTMKTGIVESASYVLSGDWRATGKGVYTATVTPAGGASWLGDGGTYPSNIVWTISALEVEPPTARADTPTYTGGSFDGFVDSSDSAWYSLSGEQTATDAGPHGFTAALNDPANTVWSDGTTADKDFAWSIAQAANSITSLSIKGWKLGGAENAPECTATFGQDTVQYAYAADAGATEWSDSVPTEPGLWYVRATIPETGNWTGATEYASFYLWSSPEDIFRDSAVITVSGYSGTAPLVNFPVLVRLADNSPVGFEYMRSGHDPANIAFVQGDELLQFDVDTWNTLGESAIWVSLPVMTNGTQFTMYWNLKDGKTAPAVDSSKVWSDYAGVWHMNDATDSTENGASGEVGSVASPRDGIFGGALGSTQIKGGPLLKIAANEAMDSLTNGSFTVSFWTYLDKANESSTGWPILFTRKKNHNEPGYGARIAGDKVSGSVNIRAYFREGTTDKFSYVQWGDNRLAVEKWQRHDVVFANGYVLWYIDGVWQRYMDTDLIPLNGSDYLAIGSWVEQTAEGTIRGSIDEFRMRAGELSGALISAEYAMATKDDFLSFGLVVRDGKKVNRWAKEPSVSPAEWDATDKPSSVAFDAGTLVEGSVQYTIQSLYSGDVYSTIDDVLAANVPGVYQIDFTMVDDDGYEPLLKTVFVFIRGPVPYDGIQGNLGDSGRVLLMNRDSNGTSPIRYQSHAATSTGNATYWTWARTEELSNDWNLQNETESILWAKGGTRLWHLYDCRHGNTHYYYNNKSPNPLPSQLESDQNYLPFSSDAYRFNSESYKVGSNNGYAAQIVMRNTTNAWVTSSCLADGIGTIYFDAVNGWTSADGGEEYKIAVEYSTATENGDAPYDEFIDDPVPVYDDKEKFVATNHYPNVVWRRAEIEAYNTETGDTTVTNELPLAISTGGSKDRFYRVTARLNTRVPTRFRICRTSYDSGWQIDKKCFILLDNIVASPPPMTAELSSPGYHAEDKDGNEALRGKRAVGWAGAFSTAFPRAGEQDVYAAASVNYVTNGVLGALSPAQLTNFVGGATMHYRWRCLDQRLAGAAGEWRTVKLNPLDGFKSMHPIDLPGFACDVEYWYDANLQAPFYRYYNYSGSSAAAGWSYSEDISAATNHAYDAGAKIFESKGTNWYVRLREGSSAYQGARVLTRPAGGTDVTAWEMDLVGNHVWRGFVQTTEAVAGGLDFRFETYNPQAGGWAEYNFETNCLCAATNLPFASIPISDLVEPATTTMWANVVCDATTGYLLFQLDDTTHSLTIAHADYQNFNKWHDAHKADGKFKGNSTEDDAKSGTSPKTRDISNDFSSWTDTPSTNDALWAESFTGFSASGYKGKKPYEPFKTIDTPNGWASGPGMWSYAKYMSDFSDMALQMSGSGDGWLQYVGPEGAAPRGIEKVSFRARLAQPISFETMSYSFAEGASVKSNYTFFAQMSLTDVPKTVNYDGDGTVSAIAYYRPKNGCYEFRVSRYSSTHTQMSIYRWSPGADESEVAATLLAQQNFASLVDALHMGGTVSAPTYGGLFISCENLSDGSGTRIVAGIRNTLDGIMLPNVAVSKEFVGLVCVDTSASRLKAGSYGFTGKNCPAVIGNPRHWDSPLTPPSSSGTASAGEASTKNYFNKTTCNLGGGGTAETEASDSLRGGDWAVERGRFDVDASTDSTYLRAKARPQRVEVQWTEAGSAANWRPLGTNVVSSYTMSTPYEQYFWTTEPASVRLKTVDEDKGADVVVDDVRISQWAGCDMGSRDASGVEYFADGDGQRGYVTNFYFSSCWVTNGMVRMSGKRTRTGDICSLRAPLMDGGGSPSRGIGLGMISFEYHRAQTNTVLLLQVATNVTDSLVNYNKETDPSLWTTVTNFTFNGLQQAELDHGTRSYYLGIHGVPGVMRLVLDPAVVSSVKGVRDEDAFGEIDITELFCRDEPELDVTCWWGWNLRMFGADGISEWDDGLRSHLPDWTFSSGGLGLSLALNNSTTDDVVKGHESDYTEHMPFVQTPTFTSNIVGEVSFKARKFALYDPAQPGEIALYGASSGDVTYDANWTELARFVVTNTFYETFSWQSVGDTYRAFRLGVTGVKGVTNPASRGSDPTEGDSPVRVMIDEVAVFEAVRPTMGFRYVYPFRTILDETYENTNVVDGAWMPLPDEQPLAEESWTIQAEIVARQLPDEIDLVTPGHEPRVFFRWYKGTDHWGYENWKLLTDAEKCGYAELARADGETMVFRGSVPLAPGALVAWNPDVDFVPMVVQYAAEVVYWNVNGSVQTNALTASEWTRPAWYDPVDYNKHYSDKGFSAFTILDTISPERVWINEVNVHDGFAGTARIADTNQYVEIAVPRRQPITNWTLEYVDNNYRTNTICIFGVPGAADTKTMHETNEYVFVTVQSPATAKAGTLSAAAGEVDGTWDNFDKNGGKLEEEYPIAFRLVRPSGVVEQAVVLEGSNMWKGTRYEGRFSATNFVAKLNGGPGGEFYFVGDEAGTAAACSLGVTNGTGAAVEDWTNLMAKTPGRANVGQLVPEGYVIYASGSMLALRGKIGADGLGHVRQKFADSAEFVLDDVLAMVLKGGDGTNIVYDVDQWWEIKSVTTNGVPVPELAGRTGTVPFAAGVGQSNDVEVVATAQPRADLRTKYGLDENNRYTTAVMAWLAGGTTKKYGAFAGSDITDDAWFGGIHDLTTTITNLTLTERYWLDIDPTDPGWVLRAGIVGSPAPVPYLIGGLSGDTYIENVRMTVQMAITNENTSSARHGDSYAPYVLRGDVPGDCSDYFSDVWTSATFKVVADLQNGMPMRKRWVPLRRFAFDPGSFDSDNRAVIDVWDPFSVKSSATSGWEKWSGCQIFYSWSLDDKGGQDAPQILKPDSTYP